MSLAANKELARRAIGFWESGSIGRPEDIVTADYINHQESDVEAGGANARSLESWKALVTGYHAAFSDSRVRVTQQIAEGDLVATRWEITAVHSGNYLGHPPTGRTVMWTGIDIDRIAGGRIAESWVDWDRYGLLRQIGLVP